jgi:hypothetical protein
MRLASAFMDASGSADIPLGRSTMRRLTLILCLLVVGCYERRMGAWLGHSYGDLITTWGVPTTRHPRPGGGAVLTWEDVELGPDGEQNCRRSFTTDRSGRIVRWAIENCDWRTADIPEPPRRP